VDKLGQSLIVAGGEFGENSVNIRIDIQPQLAKDSGSITFLRYFSMFMMTMGFIVPFGQLICTYWFKARLFYFFLYSMNIQNMSFLPCLGVSNPSQMGLFVKNLMQCATFNVNAFNNFNWALKFTSRRPSPFGMERIGIIDRAILHRTGYLIHTSVTVYIVWALISWWLDRPRTKAIRGVGIIVDTFGIFNHKAKYLMFMWVILLQIFVGAMINWDNTRLFDVSANWGFSGYLLFGDQINTILGFIAFGMCLTLPYFFYLAL